MVVFLRAAVAFASDVRRPCVPRWTARRVALLSRPEKSPPQLGVEPLSSGALARRMIGDFLVLGLPIKPTPKSCRFAPAGIMPLDLQFRMVRAALRRRPRAQRLQTHLGPLRSSSRFPRRRIARSLAATARAAMLAGIRNCPHKSTGSITSDAAPRLSASSARASNNCLLPPIANQSETSPFSAKFRKRHNADRRHDVDQDSHEYGACVRGRQHSIVVFENVNDCLIFEPFSQLRFGKIRRRRGWWLQSGRVQRHCRHPSRPRKSTPARSAPPPSAREGGKGDFVCSA